MRNKMLKKTNLICLKTGSNAKIIKHYESKNVSYVKINITMKFDNTNFHVLKTVLTSEIEKDFKYN